MGREEEDSLHTVYLQLYPELIIYPCLFNVIVIEDFRVLIFLKASDSAKLI